MPYGQYRYRRARPAVRPRRRAPARRPVRRKAPARPTRPFKTKVLRVLRTQNELKHRTIVLTQWLEHLPPAPPVTYEAAPIWGGGLASRNPDFIGTEGNGLSWHNLMHAFPIQQGTWQQQRVGNAINPKSFVLSGYITTNVYHNTDNKCVLPFEVHFVAWRTKDDPLGNTNTMLSAPTNMNVPIDGSATRSLYPWNKDQYTIIKHRVWRFKPPSRVQTVEADLEADPQTIQTIANPTAGSSNNPSFQRFRIKMPLKKKLTFNDGVGGNNVCRNEWFGCGFYTIDGNGAVISTAQSRASVYMAGTLFYTDP